MPTFGILISTKSLLYTLYIKLKLQILFVALRLMVAKRMGAHTYALTNGFLITFGPLGTTISGFMF